MLRKLMFTGMTLVMAGSGTALAQKIELQPFGGVRFGGSFNTRRDSDPSIDPPLPPIRFQLGTRPTIGLTFSYDLTEHLEVEALWSRQSTPVDTSNADQPDFTAGMSYFHGGLLYDGGNGKLRPYIAGGAGFTVINPSPAEASAFVEPSISAAAGFKYLFDGRFGLRAEFRGFATFTGDQEDLFCNMFGCVSFNSASVLWQAQFTGGLVIDF